jgi:hypothetical protein
MAAYHPRTLAATVRQASAHFPVLLLTGPRQVGKTTLLLHCAGPKRPQVTLDDLDQRALARSDPQLFLQRHPPPVLIDEVQYAPELFNAIKRAVDQAGAPGDFWLTGSQKFHLMRGVSESLAGRVAVLDLLGLSRAEITGRAAASRPFLPTPVWIEAARRQASPLPLLDAYRAIWRGALPQAALEPELPLGIFFSSYLQTYVQRDVRAMARIGDEVAFQRLVRAAAARTGQLLNIADLARDTDVDQKTARHWLGILEASGLIYLLPPWHSNVTKRLVKTPKLYFLDTGLCAHLTQWTSPESMEAGAMSGSLFETYVVGEILKSWWHNGRTAPLYFYRDRDGREADLLIDQDQRLHPIEIKKTATPSRRASAGFRALERLGRPIGPGAVVCPCEADVPLSTEVTAVPIGYL